MPIAKDTLILAATKDGANSDGFELSATCAVKDETPNARILADGTWVGIITTKKTTKETSIVLDEKDFKAYAWFVKPFPGQPSVLNTAEMEASSALLQKTTPQGRYPLRSAFANEVNVNSQADAENQEAATTCTPYFLRSAVASNEVDVGDSEADAENDSESEEDLIATKNIQKVRRPKAKKRKRQRNQKRQKRPGRQRAPTPPAYQPRCIQRQDLSPSYSCVIIIGADKKHQWRWVDWNNGGLEKIVSRVKGVKCPQYNFPEELHIDADGHL